MGPIFLFTCQTRLPFHQLYFSAIGEGTHSEVNPEALGALLYQKLVEVLLRLISDVKLLLQRFKHSHAQLRHNPFTILAATLTS